MAGGKFAHLSGADDEDVLSVQAPENLFRQFDGTRSNRPRRRSNGRLGSYAFGPRERAAKKLIQLSAHGPDGAGCRVSLFYLAENLGLAHHHRIQARSHAEN